MARLQSTDDGLSKVTFHSEHSDGEAIVLLRKGVRFAWQTIEPIASQHGMAEFPESDFWVFDDSSDAVRRSGLSKTFWEHHGGAAIGRVAYVRGWLGLDGVVGTAAHEATHVVQHGMFGTSSRGSSRCITEGAASWYASKALVLRNDGTTFAEMREDLRTLMRYWEESTSLPDIDELHPLRSFDGLTGVTLRLRYRLCEAAFDLLIETGGGEHAYFDYLAALRHSDWRTAFDQSFDEDLATFEERFALYRANGYNDYRFPSEIARGQMIMRLVSCEYSSQRTHVCAVEPVPAPDSAIGPSGIDWLCRGIPLLFPMPSLLPSSRTT